MKSVFRIMGVTGSFLGTLLTTASLVGPAHAGTVTFGAGANQFNMEFVTIGNPGNAADSFLGYGSVTYVYGIGKYEVSEDMIAKFNGLQSIQVTMDTRGINKPATGISWNEAARFVNWLNTSTNGFAAYKFTSSGANDDVDLWDAASDPLDYDPLNPYRSKRTKYVLPGIDEWWKAAYFNPSNSWYYDFPTGSNAFPIPVGSGTTANTAVYGQPFGQGPADVNQAGGLSPYGVMGLGGNVEELVESPSLMTDPSGTLHRAKGGYWADSAGNSMRRGFETLIHASSESYFRGFRVASLSSSAPPAVPEPSMMVIGTLFGLGGLVAKRRMKK